MTDSETFRLAPPVAFWWVWLGFVALNVVDFGLQGLPSARFGAVLGAILLLITGLVFTLGLRPKVIADGDGIRVLNPYRTHVVPWRLVTLVDTGEWVQVHYAAAPAPDGAGDGRGVAAAGGEAASGAGGKTVHCWALYVSSRARRKIASGPPRARAPLARGQLGLFGLGRAIRAGGLGDGAGTGAAASSRLPEEARYLASLPPAKAMAVRLDSRADRERARPGNGAEPPEATEAWSWLALAAVVVPALILLAVALA
ncbi:MAG TPA: PH domain-containing protein [Trebonia sp.]